MNKKKIMRSFAILSFIALSAVLASCGNRKSDSAEELGEDSTAVQLHAFPQETTLGVAPDYMKDVTAVQNGKKLKVTFDDSDVDLQKEGDYEVTYTATGTDGTSVSKTVTISVVDQNKKIVYLTFDDGPSPNTPRILNALRENGAHATFFITGQFPNCFKYLKDAVADGNELAAHSYRHRFAIYSSFDAYFSDLEKIEKLIEKYAGKRSHIIRFPGGSSNFAFARHNSDPNFMFKLCREVQDRGYQYVDWNADSRDASTDYPSASMVIRNSCHTYGHNRLCLLLHDSGMKNGTVAALPTIIKYFRNQGYEFGTLTSTGYICHHTLRPFVPGINRTAKKTISRSRHGSRDSLQHKSGAQQSSGEAATETTEAPKTAEPTPAKAESTESENN